MTPRPAETHPALNLVASDLFFGVGAVILVVVAALSLGLKDMVARIVADRTASAEETRLATAALVETSGLKVLLADAQGLHRMQGKTDALIALDDLWQSDQLSDWFAEEPLLIIAASGQETAFLTFSRAAEFHPAPLATLRLTQDCRELRRLGDRFQCQP